MKKMLGKIGPKFQGAVFADSCREDIIIHLHLHFPICPDLQGYKVRGDVFVHLLGNINAHRYMQTNAKSHSNKTKKPRNDFWVLLSFDGKKLLRRLSDEVEKNERIRPLKKGPWPMTIQWISTHQLSGDFFLLMFLAQLSLRRSPIFRRVFAAQKSVVRHDMMTPILPSEDLCVLLPKKNLDLRLDSGFFRGPRP